MNYMKFSLLPLVLLLMTLTGCATYGGGDYYTDDVVETDPGLYLFGGGYDRGRDVHNYSQRGFASRAVAHPGGGGARGGRR